LVVLVLLLLVIDIVIIIQQHHFFIVATFHFLMASLPVLSAVFIQLFQLICVGGTYELAIHVEDLSLRVHQKLSVISFNLNSSHYHVVFKVDGHLFTVLPILLDAGQTWLTGFVVGGRHRVQVFIPATLYLILHVWVSILK
jgi:hypothetical protein